MASRKRKTSARPEAETQKPKDKRSRSSGDSIGKDSVFISFLFRSDFRASSLVAELTKDEAKLFLPTVLPKFINAIQLTDEDAIVAKDYKWKFYAPTEAFQSDMGPNLVTQDYLDTLLEDKFVLLAVSMHLERLCERAAALRKAVDDDIIILGITAHRRTGGGNVDDVSLRLSPMRCYEDLIADPGLAPSTGQIPSEYALLQSKPCTTIYDGRRPLSGQPTVAPPIYMYHSIFADFYRFLAEAHSEMTVEHIRLTKKFIAVNEPIYPKENARLYHVWRALNEVLSTSIHSEVNTTDDTLPDGLDGVHVLKTRVPCVIAEGKNTEGRGDPSSQVSLSYRKFWRTPDKKPIRDLCVCPKLCLSLNGPWLCVMGAVMTQRIIVQRLTGMEWLVCSSTDDGARILQLASILWAVRQTVQKLKSFYLRLGRATPQPVERLRSLYPRFYPTPTTFPCNGQNITFSYLSPLQTHPTCVMFKAKITIMPTGSACKDLHKGSTVVVKFVSTYREDVHRFLEDHQFAPALYYVGKVPEWEWAIMALQPPTNTQTHGLTFGRPLMVVMAFVEPKRIDKDLEGQQVAHILHRLHSAGFVFGDLRAPNIIFDGKCLKLIDFDWAGRFNLEQAKRNLQGMPLLVREAIMSNTMLDLANTESARYPINICNNLFLEEGLAPILPQHDWHMWRMLYGLTCDQGDVILRNHVS